MSILKQMWEWTWIYSPLSSRAALPYTRGRIFCSPTSNGKAIAGRRGGLQIIYAGKAHPQDQLGKEQIERVFRARHLMRDTIKTAYLENDSMGIGKMMTAGVDVWLNTPLPPMEAFGRSGMKAAVNGVPSLSVLDGWWIEGCIAGVTGWSFGPSDGGAGVTADHGNDAASLYDTLAQIVMPLFCHNRDDFLDVMRHAIALNGSFFNTHRMLRQYGLKVFYRFMRS
jgi:starch phosphorylase